MGLGFRGLGFRVDFRFRASRLRFQGLSQDLGVNGKPLKTSIPKPNIGAEITTTTIFWGVSYCGSSIYSTPKPYSNYQDPHYIYIYIYIYIYVYIYIYIYIHTESYHRSFMEPFFGTLF